jgi:NTE family protein
MTMRSLVIIFLTLTLAACACYRKNPPLQHYDPAYGYRFSSLTAEHSTEPSPNFIIVSLSGGGTRAAALAYGALARMNQDEISNGRTLLDEVDVISSVSGGSFASAYLGTFGKDRFIDHFRDDVLYRQIQRDVIVRLFEPWHWPEWMLYGRSDIAESYYNSEIFAGQTYKSIPYKRPYIILNATDISWGARFEFTQEYFDRMCSDLSPVPIARAVLASSAFPVAFTPVTLKNYGAAACGYKDPIWVGEALQDFYGAPTRYDRAQAWTSYENATKRPYIHLSDGGLADNIGLRGPEVALTSGDSSWSLLPALNKRQLQRIAVIVVDAKGADDHSLDHRASRPNLLTVLEDAATNPMENYSSDTIELLRQGFSEWEAAETDYETNVRQCKKLAASICSGTKGSSDCKTERAKQCDAAFHANMPPPQPKLYRMHVRLDAESDPVKRKRLLDIPTSLELSRDDVELLIQEGGELLAKSPAYSQLLADLRTNSGAIPSRP